MLKFSEINSYFRARKTFKELLSQLKKAETDAEIDEIYTHDQLIDAVKFVQRFRNTSTTYRNVVAKEIRQLKKYAKVHINDYSPAKRAYEEFIEKGGIVDIDTLKKGDFVTVMSEEYVTKGDYVYGSYYFNRNIYAEVGKTYCIAEIRTDSNIAYVEGIGMMGLVLGQFRFATPEEILDKKIEDLQRLVKEQTVMVKKLHHDAYELEKKLGENRVQLNDSLVEKAKLDCQKKLLKYDTWTK